MSKNFLYTIFLLLCLFGAICIIEYINIDSQIQVSAKIIDKYDYHTSNYKDVYYFNTTRGVIPVNQNIYNQYNINDTIEVYIYADSGHLVEVIE